MLSTCNEYKIVREIFCMFSFHTICNLMCLTVNSTSKLLYSHTCLMDTVLDRIGLEDSSVAQSCTTLCDPMDWGTPGFPVHHQLLELDKFTFIESVMPSNHLMLCRPLLLLPPIPPSIRVFSNVYFYNNFKN